MIKGKVLFFFVLLYGLAYGQPTSGEVDQPTHPQVPYRMPLQDYNSLLERQARTHIFVTQSTPAPRSILTQTGPVELTLTFNQAIDPQTLPPECQGWRLDSPWGEIDKENLSEFGTITFSRLPVSEGGISYPPNTLRLRLAGNALQEDQPLQCSLWLNKAPTDYLGRPVEDFGAIEAAYHQWDFRVEPESESQLGGSLYLDWQRGEEREVLRSPLLFDWEERGESVFLTLRVGEAPFTLPYRERSLVLRLPREAWRQGEEVTIAPGRVEGFLTEWVYEDFHPPQGTQIEPVERQRWNALTGSVTLQPWTSKGRVVKLQLDLASEVDAEVESRLGGVVTLPPLNQSRW